MQAETLQAYQRAQEDALKLNEAALTSPDWMKFRKTLLSIAIQVNAPELCSAEGAKSMLKMYNTDTLLRNFINRVAFNFISDIGRDEYLNVVRDLAYAVVVQPETTKGMACGISADYLNSLPDLDTVLALLFNNRPLVIMLLIHRTLRLK